jgi:hypothetical protein
MRTAALLLAGLVAASAGSGGGAAASPKVQQPQPKPAQPIVRIPVWVYVAPKLELQTACGEQSVPKSLQKEKPPSGQLLPKTIGVRDVLVPTELLQGSKETTRFPFSCVDKKMVTHEEAHKKLPQTVIRLSYKARESAQFLSVTKFRVLGIDPHGPAGAKLGPYPFDKNVLNPPTQYGQSHETGVIVEQDSINQLYKVFFEINGFRVDPDIECRP